MYLLDKHYSVLPCVPLLCVYVLSFGRSNKHNLWPVTTIVLHKLSRINGCDLGSCGSKWSTQGTSHSTHSHLTTQKHSSVQLRLLLLLELSDVDHWRLAADPYEARSKYYMLLCVARQLILKRSCKCCRRSGRRRMRGARARARVCGLETSMMLI